TALTTGATPAPRCRRPTRPARPATRVVPTRCWRRPVPTSGWRPRTSPPALRRSSPPSRISSAPCRWRCHRGRAADTSATLWAGGTRIGAALAAFNDGWGRRGTARGSIVVIVSDGWETGDPSVLGEQMARLARLAQRIIWVNPRSAGAAYRPLVAGMAAALPHVDTFLSGHSLDALDELLTAI